MITIKHDEYIGIINRYAEQKSLELRTMLMSAGAFIDRDYAQQTIDGLKTFSAVIRKQGLQDIAMFSQDTAFATKIAEDYQTFGEYCYDMLYQAFKATNETLLANNQLMYDIKRLIALDYSDFVVTSNYIALNNFSNIAKLELTNFRQMFDVGLCYDMHLNAKQILTTNIVDKLQPVLPFYIELAEFLQLLHNDKMQELLHDWTTNVNTQLMQTKLAADLAWHTTFAAYKDILSNMSFQKQVGSCICNISIQNDVYTETLKYKQHTKTINWRERDKLLHLDYMNNLNFAFVDERN